MVEDVLSCPAGVETTRGRRRVFPILALVIVVLLTLLVWTVLPHWPILTVAGTREH